MIWLLPLAGWAQVDFTGFLKLDKRFVTGGDSTYISNFYNRFRLEMRSSPNSKLFLFTSLDVRFYDFPDSRTLRDLSDLKKTFPADIMLWESYLDIYGFLTDKLDLRIGRQRNAWGKADRLNPTDNLNSHDFTDLVHFYDRVPSWAVKGTWYFNGGTQLAGIWMPSLDPSLFPKGTASLFTGMPAGYTDSLSMPARTLGKSMIALRLSGSLSAWDYSVSYMNGYDNLPLPEEVYLPGENRKMGSMILGFPHRQILGANIATELSGIGVWGEFAVFFPDKMRTRIETGGVAMTRVALSRKPYPSFTIGGDYTFPGNWYVNGQWMHGFYTETGAGNQNDYLFTQIKKTILNDDLIIQMNGGLETDNISRLYSNGGYFLNPEISYEGIDNFRAIVGDLSINGARHTQFGSWKSLDQIYVSFRVDF